MRSHFISAASSPDLQVRTLFACSPSPRECIAPRIDAVSVAGGLAGSSVSFLLHPLDTLKTMKQVCQQNARAGESWGEMHPVIQM